MKDPHITNPSEDTSYITEMYRGCPMTMEASVLKELADRGIDGFDMLRLKIDEVVDTTRTFAEALYEIKAGQKMRRQAWVPDRFVYLVQGSEFVASRPPLNKMFDGQTIRYAAHIDVFDSDNNASVWHATNADLLADDWHIAAPPK